MTNVISYINMNAWLENTKESFVKLLKTEFSKVANFKCGSIIKKNLNTLLRNIQKRIWLNWKTYAFLGKLTVHLSYLLKLN